MNELVQQMKVVLATTFAFYLKAHNFHWNVEGPNFPQYHELFKGVYEDAWGAVDEIAERIRTLDAYAPGSMSRFSTLSAVDEQLNIPEAKKMVAELEQDNKIILGLLLKTQQMSEANGKFGLADYLQGRIDAHEKLGWMLRATGK
jgi:starvation-inducible DNA-binding protein